jgi:transcriptional regulator with PAS, ATPase and Fis domain
MSIIYKSTKIEKCINLCKKYAQSNASILLTGESGVGKEVFCDFIKDNSKRKDKSIIKINCAAIPNELIESEFFGSVQGAYTGSVRHTKGIFGTIDGGTLFLDEISEMPINLQSKLLRVIQDREYKPVGSAEYRKVNCRIISATNINPEIAIKNHKLRPDLYYRLAELTLKIPSLRDRLDDIIPLAEFFTDYFQELEELKDIKLSEEARCSLLSYDWPGNVRELRSEIYRSVLICEDKTIYPKDFSFKPVYKEIDEMPAIERAEKELFLSHLEKNDFKIKFTAQSLGIPKSTLYNKLKYYKIDKIKYDK